MISALNEFSIVATVKVVGNIFHRQMKIPFMMQNYRFPIKFTLQFKIKSVEL